MKKIKFTKVGMKNYVPYIEQLEYKIEPDTLTLITGPNGIGKTMSLDAIPYTLYGMRSNGARGDDVVNNKVQKNCRTWVEFKINDDLYRVDRYHKYTKLGNTVTLKKNGEVIKKGQKDVLPEVERIVLPRKLFMNTIMFGQKVKDFFTDLTDGEKKEIFRKVLALDDYITYYEKAKNRAKEYEVMNQKIVNELNVSQRLIAEADTNILEQIAKREAFNKERTQKINDLKVSLGTEKKRLKELELRFKTYDSDEKLLEDLNSKISQTMSEISLIKEKYKAKHYELDNASKLKVMELKSQANTTRTEINDEYNHLSGMVKDEIAKVTENFTSEFNKESENKHKAQMSLKVLSTEINNCDSEKFEYENALSQEIAICPTCNQELQDKDHIQKKLDELIKKITKLKESAVSYQSAISDIENTIKAIEKYRDTKLAEADAKMKPLLENKNVKTAELDGKLTTAIEKVLGLMNDQKTKYDQEEEQLNATLQGNLSDLEIQRKEIQEKIKQLKELEKVIASQKELINRIQYMYEKEDEKIFDDTELKRAEHKKQQYEGAIVQLTEETEKLKRKIDICEFWKQAYSPTGIPSMLIDESVPFMNEKVCDYLDKISNGRYLVSFDTLAETKSGEFRDKISVHVLDTQTQANSRLQFSGGQTRLIDIATILTLGDLQSSVQEVEFNILLFDEILDSLDDTNIGYVSKVIKSLATEKSIFIISHRHVDQLEADEVYNYA